MTKKTIYWEKEIISGKDPVFRIASYQRFFEWKKTHIKNLIDSIKNEIFISAGSYFINEKKEYEIVDGQQRITTLSLIFGRIKKYKFKLNTDPKIEEALNAIIRRDIKTTHRYTIKKSSYLKHIHEISEFIDKELPKKDLLDLFDKVSFPLNKINNKSKIFEIFRKANSTGSQVGVSSIYKAYLISQCSESEVQTLNSNWFEAVENVHWISNESIHEPKIDDLFVQSYNSSEFKDISKSKKTFSKKQISTKIGNIFVEYTEWAKNLLIKKNKKHQNNINDEKTLNLVSLNGKIVPDILPLVFLVHKNIKNVKLTSKCLILLALILNLYVCSNEISKKEFKASIFEIKERLRYPKTKLSIEDIEEYLTDSLVLLSKKWSGEFKSDFLDNIKFWYSGKKQENQDYSYKMNKPVTHVAFIIKSILFEIGNIRRYVLTSEADEKADFEKMVEEQLIHNSISAMSISELIDKYKYVKISQSNWTIEHLKNKYEPNLKYIDYCTKDTQNLLGNKDIWTKLKIIEKCSDKEFLLSKSFKSRHKGGDLFE